MIGDASSRPEGEDERAVGACIGRYIVRGLLGSGSSAVVYDAEHQATGRRVALKTLHADLAGNEMIRKRFRREMRVLGGLRAPNLVDAIDGGTLDDGSPFLVLERLNGPTLATLLDHGPLALPAAIEVMHGVLEALAVLHAEGIVHRDLKPANIVIHSGSTGQVVKLLDLGVCAFIEDLKGAPRVGRQGKLTGDGRWIGTPCYMSPEQVDGRLVDARTDVYGAGVVLYECLTGRTPFEADTTLDVVTAVQRRPVIPPAVVRPSCPMALDALVLQALNRDAQARPQTAAEFSHALAAIALKQGLSTGAEALDMLPDPASLPIPLTQIIEQSGVVETLDDTLPRIPQMKRVPSIDAYHLPRRHGPSMRSVLLAVGAIAAVAALSAYATTPTPHRPVVARPAAHETSHVTADSSPLDADVALALEFDPPLAPVVLVPEPTLLPTAVHLTRHASKRGNNPAPRWQPPAPLDETIAPLDETIASLDEAIAPSTPPAPLAPIAAVAAPEIRTTPNEPFIPSNPFGPANPPRIPANPFLGE